MHVFPLILLALAVLVLGINWAVTENTTQETLVTAMLGAGAMVLFVLKWKLVRKGHRND